MQAWFLLGQLLRVGGGGRVTQCHVLDWAPSRAPLGGQSLSHRIGGVEQDTPPQAGVPQLSFSLFKVFHSCWAMICGEAWLSLSTVPWVLQTAGRQTAG